MAAITTTSAACLPSEGRSDFIARRLVCPVCELSFTAWDVAPWALDPLDEDTDLRRHYAGPDPLYYVAVVCPGCHYAALGQDWYDLSPDEAACLRDLDLPSQDAVGAASLYPERHAGMALRALRLAWQCYEHRQRPHRQRLRGQLALYVAWCARDLGNLGEARRWRGVASYEFAAALDCDSALTAREKLVLGYLVGDLAARLGQSKRALRYLQAALQNPSVGDYPATERRVRDGCARATLAERLQSARATGTPSGRLVDAAA